MMKSGKKYLAEDKKTGKKYLVSVQDNPLVKKTDKISRNEFLEVLKRAVGKR